MTAAPVAILYQAIPPPMFDGLRKEAKPGGYSDGGADIAVALRSVGQPVVTPVPSPDPAVALDWVFPDTVDGIRSAGAAGATILWANTVLFAGHPLDAALADFDVVGQSPAATQKFDDKFATNRMLGDAGLSVARSFLLSQTRRDHVFGLADVEATCAAMALSFPLIVKPIRGRGSQGVTLVADPDGLRRAAGTLIAAATPRGAEANDSCRDRASQQYGSDDLGSADRK